MALLLNLCSYDQREADAQENGSKRGGLKGGSSHALPKTHNGEELNESLKSLLAMEIKRQVLDGLGEAGHSQVQDLEVLEIEDLVSGTSMSTDSNSEEENEKSGPKPYVVKMKLLATVCIPIFLQTAPQSPLNQQTCEESNILEVDGREALSFRKPSEHHQAALRKPLSLVAERWSPHQLQEKSSSTLLQGECEKCLCNKVPSNASIVITGCPKTKPCDIPNWRERLDSEVGGCIGPNEFEVHDFDTDKSEDKFVEGQIWALYDDTDGMPRHYAQITDVRSVHPFEVSITWLAPHTRTMEELVWVASGVSITCGVFELRDPQHPIKLTHVHHFSHPVKSLTGFEGELIITPSKGEVWALYKDQIACSYTSQRIGGKYELVQVVGKDRDTHVLTVVPLLKISEFRTRFVQEEWPFTIAPKDFLKFSHQIPAYMLKEKPTVYLELDPASTPELYN